MNVATLNRNQPARIVLLLVSSFLLFGGYRSCVMLEKLVGSTGNPPELYPGKPSGKGIGSGVIATMVLSKAPKHVRQLIRYLKNAKTMKPPNGYKGGRVFRNREGRLPKGKMYYEFDAHPHIQGAARGGERLVVDQQKSVFYYTKDHYNTFIQIIE